MKDRDHWDECRKCFDIINRADGVPARKALGRPNARGLFCQSCADREIKLNRLVRKANLQ